MTPRSAFVSKVIRFGGHVSQCTGTHRYNRAACHKQPYSSTNISLKYSRQIAVHNDCRIETLLLASFVLRTFSPPHVSTPGTLTQSIHFQIAIVTSRSIISARPAPPAPSRQHRRPFLLPLLLHQQQVVIIILKGQVRVLIQELGYASRATLEKGKRLILNLPAQPGNGAV